MKIFKTIFLSIFFLNTTFSFSQDMTKNTLALIDSFFDLRMNLSLIEESETDKINSEIDSFAVKNKDKISVLSEIENLVLENFIIMEKYNYLYEKPGQAKVQHEILGNQLKKIESFVENNQINDAYFFCTQADITSCYMGYSVGDVLKYGTSVRPLYEKALECNSNLSYALTNIGQWYYFAPGIVGGSKKKTLSYFEKARECAVTDSQKYFADIFLSQLLFEKKEFERCNSLLSEAESICPNSNYLKKIRSANQQGFSLFEYNRKKSSLDKESKKIE